MAIAYLQRESDLGANHVHVENPRFQQFRELTNAKLRQRTRNSKSTSNCHPYIPKSFEQTAEDYEFDPVRVVDFAAIRQYLLGWIFDLICAGSSLAVSAVSPSGV